MMQMQKCHLVLSHLSNNLPETFRDLFTYASNQHQYHTREAYSNEITIPQVKTTHYGLQSIKYKAARDLDKIQKELKSINFSDEYL